MTPFETPISTLFSGAITPTIGGAILPASDSRHNIHECQETGSTWFADHWGRRTVAHPWVAAAFSAIPYASGVPVPIFSG
ncbi:hypothetical protein A5904_05465 [Acidithiobacillus caldus]|nr:hypothetical protein A5904_05465 [Acidithiobacillus caldus]